MEPLWGTPISPRASAPDRFQDMGIEVFHRFVLPLPCPAAGSLENDKLAPPLPTALRRRPGLLLRCHDSQWSDHLHGVDVEDTSVELRHDPLKKTASRSPRPPVAVTALVYILHDLRLTNEPPPWKPGPRGRSAIWHTACCTRTSYAPESAAAPNATDSQTRDSPATSDSPTFTRETTRRNHERSCNERALAQG